jgi:hypothetical protein
MTSFWLKFAIQESVSLAEVFIQSSSLKPALKTALEKLIADGQAVIAAL